MFDQVGGCGVTARGQAAMAREDHDHPANQYGSDTRRAANAVVHCESRDVNCEHTETWNRFQDDYFSRIQSRAAFDQALVDYELQGTGLVYLGQPGFL